MQSESRRTFFRKISGGLFALPLFDVAPFKKWFQTIVTPRLPKEKVYFTTGFKVMEVGETSALIWTRLCGQEIPNPIRHKRREQVFRHPIDFDEDQQVDKMDGGVKAIAGQVRFRLVNNKEEKMSAWIEASSKKDYTVKFLFDGLMPDTTYHVEIEGRSAPDAESAVAKGKFNTLPEASVVKPVNLVTSTCQYFWSYDDNTRGFRTYVSMRRLKPDFFIHTGDYVYYDKPGPLGTTVAKARHQWHAMDAWPSLRDFFSDVPVYMIKDDHDVLRDDAFPGMGSYGELTFEQGLDIWYENVPLANKPYRSMRWGKDLQIWMVEGREFRSPNSMPDGETKSIWGEEQKNWLMSTVKASDATFKLLFTATPVVGPDRDTKKDNHANKVFQTEGHWLRNFLSQQKGMYVVNGDRHWQYVSQDSATGLTEFGSGPVSDYHAQGWDPDDLRPQHRFLRVKGGFLQIRADRENGKPFIIFIHRDVNGEVTHEEKRWSV